MRTENEKKKNLRRNIPNGGGGGANSEIRLCAVARRRKKPEKKKNGENRIRTLVTIIRHIFIVINRVSRVRFQAPLIQRSWMQPRLTCVGYLKNLSRVWYVYCPAASSVRRNSSAFFNKTVVLCRYSWCHYAKECSYTAERYFTL